MKYSSFTIIEIIFYFVIVGTLLLTAMTFAMQILTVNSVSQNLNELSLNRSFIIEKMTTAIHTAASIDVGQSMFDTDTGTLSLTMPSDMGSPIKFYLANGVIYMQEGTNSPVQLTTNGVQCTILRFHRITAAKTPDQIVIDGMLSSGTSDLSNLQKELSFHISLSLRTL